MGQAKIKFNREVLRELCITTYEDNVAKVYTDITGQKITPAQVRTFLRLNPDVGVERREYRARVRAEWEKYYLLKLLGRTPTKDTVEGYTLLESQPEHYRKINLVDVISQGGESLKELWKEVFSKYRMVDLDYQLYDIICRSLVYKRAHAYNFDPRQLYKDSKTQTSLAQKEIDWNKFKGAAGVKLW